jgi:hypothetical protein
MRTRDLIGLATAIARKGQPDGFDLSYSGYEMGVVARHPYDEGVWLGDICALRSLPEGVDVVLSLCRVAKADLPRHAEQIDIRLIDQPGPYGVWVHGDNDTIGAATSVEKVATGLSLTKAADVLEIVGSIDAEVRQQAYELGGTLAATLIG